MATSLGGIPVEVTCVVGVSVTYTPGGEYPPVKNAGVVIDPDSLSTRLLYLFNRPPELRAQGETQDGSIADISISLPTRSGRLDRWSLTLDPVVDLDRRQRHQHQRLRVDPKEPGAVHRDRLLVDHLIGAPGGALALGLAVDTEPVPLRIHRDQVIAQELLPEHRALGVEQAEGQHLGHLIDQPVTLQGGQRHAGEGDGAAVAKDRRTPRVVLPLHHDPLSMVDAGGLDRLGRSEVDPDPGIVRLLHRVLDRHVDPGEVELRVVAYKGRLQGLDERGLQGRDKHGAPYFWWICGLPNPETAATVRIAWCRKCLGVMPGLNQRTPTLRTAIFPLEGPGYLTTCRRVMRPGAPG